MHGGKEMDERVTLNANGWVFFTNESGPNVTQVFRKMENLCLREIWMSKFHEWLEHGSKSWIVKKVGQDELQFGQFGRLVEDLAEAPFQTYAGQSGTRLGQSFRYGRKSEPQLKCSGCPDLHAGLVPRTNPQTEARHPPNSSVQVQISAPLVTPPIVDDRK
ncbi:hypothetical protein IGI04_007187 [Brassica rapa subsp. trilocularis]|uniref:Uncharacterized protein n=1 Tax=Brassica rapa subsp. trilocularis TaxID=1813537 RepID=A0ABQ7NJ07_BRACM|nr:hypothetical protein IGI04_007187 [Brassica rapa subsp. trilocularis]